ncbi:MAG: MFS transporter, partial [Anaerolineales bacterium]|nr:MFS transporter [Anaerolineales bacterium]
DTYSAFLAPLLPLLQFRLGLNYGQLGGLALFLQLPSLATPFIGYLADRISLRYFVIFAPAVTATLMSVLGFAPNYFVVALLLFATGISVACFHAPAPAMISQVSGRRIGTGMSLFMAGGELGRTLGPLAVAWGLAYLTADNFWQLMFVGWAVTAVLYWRLHDVAARPAGVAPAQMAAFWPSARRFFPLLSWVITARMFMIGALTTFLVVYMSDVLNVDYWLAALSLTILEGAGVAGALLSGTLSDHFGRRNVLLVLFICAPLLMLAFSFSPTWLALPLLLALGFTAIAPTPVILAAVQDQFPDHRAVANGTYIALNFTIRAVATFAVGLLADNIGLNTAFSLSALLALTSLPALWRLPFNTPPANT